MRSSLYHRRRELPAWDHTRPSGDSAIRDRCVAVAAVAITPRTAAEQPEQQPDDAGDDHDTIRPSHTADIRTNMR
jgi:hypothetical protein